MPADVTGKSLGDEASWQTRDGVRLDIFSFEISRTVSTSDPPVSRKKKPWTAAVTSRVGGGGVCSAVTYLHVETGRKW